VSEKSVGFFYQHLPWNFITKFHEGVVVQKDGILQRTFAYRAPDIDSSSGREIAGLALRVNDFAKRLGAGWAFQMEAQRFQTQEYPKAHFEYPTGNYSLLAPYLIDREREAAFRASGKHFESSYYLTFIWKPPSESMKKLTQLFIQSGISGGGKSMQENVEFFVNETNAVASVLAYDMLLEPLNNEETVAYLHASISMNRHPIRFPATQIMLDRILPDCELDTSLTMKLGEYWIPIVGINDFPEETYPAILDDLNRLRLEHRWMVRYICLDKEAGKKEAQKKEKAHRGSRKTLLQTFAESTTGEVTQTRNHGAGVKEEDAINAAIEIETDIASLGYYTTCVMVWATDLETAKQYADTVRSVINSKGFTCKQETFNALEAFKSMMPGQVYANYRALPVMTNTLSHIVPLSSVWAGMRRNIHAGNVTGVDLPHLICSTAEGTPFYFNLNPSDVGHAAVWGPTGAGKSTFLNLLEMQFFKYPHSRVFVFDKDRSCRQPCLACGGLFYEPAAENDSGVSFQPLRDLDTDKDLLNAIDFIETLFTANNYEVTPPMRVAIKESLEQLKDKPEQARTLTSFIQYCNYHDQSGRPVIKEMLRDYLWDGGKYGKIFDAKFSAISLDARFIAFEMDQLMKQGDGCIIPALFYLFTLIEKMFDGRLTLLILDEAWLFLKNEIFSAKIGEWLKTLRKKNVFVVFATQDVADVEKSALKTTIIQQCLTKIYLADPNASTDGMFEVYSAFGLTDAEIGVIASATMKRDYFYTSPLGRRLFRLDLGKVTLGLIGGADHKSLDELTKGFEPGSSFCSDILTSKHIDYRHLLGEDAPSEAEPRQKTVEQQQAIHRIEVQSSVREDEAQESKANKGAEVLDELSAFHKRNGRDGTGREMEACAKRLGVSRATLYQAKRILKDASDDVIQAVKRGNVSIKTAYTRLDTDVAKEVEAKTA